MREAAAILLIRVAKIDGTENLADIFTKIAPCDSYEEEAFGIALLLSNCGRVVRWEDVGSFPGAAWCASIRKDQVSHWVCDSLIDSL